jgi:hypothetical protein
MELNNLPCLESSSREVVIKLAITASLDLLTVTKQRVEHATCKHLKQALEEASLHPHKNDWQLVDDNGSGNDNSLRKLTPRTKYSRGSEGKQTKSIGNKKEY